jgi:hypothetical protein
MTVPAARRDRTRLTRRPTDRTRDSYQPRGHPMTPSARRVWWCVGIVLAQLSLGAAALSLCGVTTEGPFLLHAPSYSHRPVVIVQVAKHKVYRGYPMAWAEYSQSASVTIPPGTEQRGPLVLTAMNPWILIAFGLVAVCCPPAVAGFLACGTTSLPRWTRLCWVLLHLHSAPY